VSYVHASSVVVPSEVITGFVLHLKITVDHKAPFFCRNAEKFTDETAAGGSHVARLNHYVGPRNFSESMNATKRLQYRDGDLRQDKIVNSVIKEKEVFFAISCFYVTDILFLSQKLLRLYPKCVRCCDVW